MCKILLTGAALLAFCAAAYGQAAQPVTPIVNGSAVSTDNPLPVTGGGGGGGCAGTSGTPCIVDTNASGNLINAIEGPIGAGSNIIGKVGIDQTTPGTTNAVSSQPVTSGGLLVYFVQPTASDNHAAIKNGAGQVYKISVFNNSATVNYLRLYDAGTGFNGCNSATGIKGQWQIPASTSVGGIADSWDLGIAFSTGISICITSGYATTDTTSATATALSVNIGYK